MGLQISWTKTKAMVIPSTSLPPPLSVGGEAVEFVDKFTYLSLVIHADGQLQPDTRDLDNNTNYRNDRNIDVFDMRCLRTIEGIRWYDIVQNSDIHWATQQPQASCLRDV